MKVDSTPDLVEASLFSSEQSTDESSTELGAAPPSVPVTAYGITSPYADRATALNSAGAWPPALSDDAWALNSDLFRSQKNMAAPAARAIQQHAIGNQERPQNPHDMPPVLSGVMPWDSSAQGKKENASPAAAAGNQRPSRRSGGSPSYVSAYAAARSTGTASPPVRSGMAGSINGESENSKLEKDVEDEPGTLTPYSYSISDFTKGTDQYGDGFVYPNVHDFSLLLPLIAHAPEWDSRPKVRMTADSKNSLLNLGCLGKLVLRVEGGVVLNGPYPDLIIFHDRKALVSYGENAPVPAKLCVAEGILTDAGMVPGPDICGEDGGQSLGIEATVPGLHPEDAGGDAIDLSRFGVDRAKFIIIKDIIPPKPSESGRKKTSGRSMGFSIDSVYLRNTEAISDQQEQTKGSL